MAHGITQAKPVQTFQKRPIGASGTVLVGTADVAAFGFHSWHFRTFVKGTLAFSLVEMLVVIAIIALLVTLLSPSITRMVVKGRKAECVANLRNLVAASQQFFADNNGVLFSRDYPTDLRPYLEGKDSWWNPSLFKKSGLTCPSVYALGGGKFNSGIYGLNYVFINEIGGMIPGTPPPSWPLRTVNISKPAKAYLFSEAGRCLSDGSMNVDPLGFLTPGSLAVEPKPGVASLVWPHDGGRKNFGFLDGHVESLSWSEVNAFNGKSSNSPEYKEFHGLRE